MKITAPDHRNETSTAAAGVIYVHKKKCVKEITWGGGFQYADFATAKFMLDSFLSVREDSEKLRVTIIERNHGPKIVVTGNASEGEFYTPPTREANRVYFDGRWFVTIDGKAVPVKMPDWINPLKEEVLEWVIR